MQSSRLLERIAAALERIADALELEAGTVVCEHTNRDQVGGFGGVAAWRCRDCGYQPEGV